MSYLTQRNNTNNTNNTKAVVPDFEITYDLPEIKPSYIQNVDIIIKEVNQDIKMPSEKFKKLRNRFFETFFDSVYHLFTVSDFYDIYSKKKEKEKIKLMDEISKIIENIKIYRYNNIKQSIYVANKLKILQYFDNLNNIEQVKVIAKILNYILPDIMQKDIYINKYFDIYDEFYVKTYKIGQLPPPRVGRYMIESSPTRKTGKLLNIASYSTVAENKEQIKVLPSKKTIKYATSTKIGGKTTKTTKKTSKQKIKKRTSEKPPKKKISKQKTKKRTSKKKSNKKQKTNKRINNK